MKLLAAVAILLISSVVSNNEVTKNVNLNNMTVEDMKTVFFRSEEEHQASINALTKDMTVPKAMAMLEQSHLASKELSEIHNIVLKINDVGDKGHRLRQPKGYDGLEPAKILLNDMIYESLSKYDNEIAKCTEYYSKQCAGMEVCRGQIAASNYIAANSRALILDSQTTINRCEVDIPTRKLELKQHNLKCEHEIYKMNERLKIVLGDIAVMTTILEMTDCDANSALVHKQFNMLQCMDPCSKKKYIRFNDKELQEKVVKLKSTLSQELMSDTFNDLFKGVKGLETFAFLKTKGTKSKANTNVTTVTKVRARQDPTMNPQPNVTNFTNPPLPRSEVPANPCTDPNMGAPSAADKAAAKCVLSPGQCYKLQERFLLIQSGIQDERDQLKEDIATMENYCEETKQTMETQIEDDQNMLDNAQTKLALATEKEATAAESARQTAAMHDQLDGDLKTQMKKCSDNYIGFEGELCALKKIRGELYKMKGAPDSSSFFQDCEVSKWEAEECTKVCAGGEQKLSRAVLTHPNGGAKCLPLDALRSCNNQPCPVDCKLAPWAGWSKCSAECGGGVQQRLREVKRAMKYGGKPCGKTSETIACNGQACEKDCDLSEWTDWAVCSKHCDGGTSKRFKVVAHEPEGAGTCPDKWDLKRLEYKKCNMVGCAVPNPNAPMPCNKSLDVILLIDGSGSLGKEGWKAEVKAAKMVVDSFAGSGPEGESKANVAVILYSGPPTWGGVSKCTGKSTAKVDLEGTCRIKTVEHFSRDMKKIGDAIEGMQWPQGSTLTSLALMTAKSEFSLGRADVESVVIVFTDGRPLSFRKTTLASMAVRKAARLLWVPVTEFAPLKWIKKWATRRWQENVVQVDTFEQLDEPSTITQLIADICPDEKLAKVEPILG
jgi:hypothetical protein